MKKRFDKRQGLGGKPALFVQDIEPTKKRPVHKCQQRNIEIPKSNVKRAARNSDSVILVRTRFSAKELKSSYYYMYLAAWADKSQTDKQTNRPTDSCVRHYQFSLFLFSMGVRMSCNIKSKLNKVELSQPKILKSTQLIPNFNEYEGNFLFITRVTFAPSANGTLN